ncbi:RICIN domain-containing protein [Nocardiopsis sp. EMB25]|uniref:RICIN domain-containing protein n=1 Tax=Nocardiopsis sp. EMB25 TaxID=2835867 RepID=UPI0022834D1E|nr:RICIN domain-containing protein [Nocardiopsis sp. EMB25]MCY9785871.1 RICIN domain-containing protein [Nocardiopsis sp. EMB25]
MRGGRTLGRAAAVIGAAAMLQAGLGGAAVHAEEYGGGTADRVATSSQKNVYRLVNANSGLCAGVAGSRTDEGAWVIQWDCLGIADQEWEFVHGGAGYYNLRNGHSGMCLAVSEPDQNGAYIVQRNCAIHPAQGWRLDKDPETGTTELVNYGSQLNLAVAESSADPGYRLVQRTPETGPDEEWILRSVQ